MPKALLEVIGTLLDNSALFIELCVSHLTYRFAFANGPLLAAPTPTPSIIYSVTFTATVAHTLETSMHLGGETVSPPTTAFRNIFFDSRIMKTLLLELVSSGKRRGTREDATRALVSVGKDAI